MVEIPDKLQFKIGEVSRIAGVKPHVLRYWESEFSQLRLQKTPSNQRVYRRRDVEVVLLIRELLYDRGFTIAGAKKYLRQAAGVGQEAPAESVAPKADAPNAANHPNLSGLRGELEELLRLVHD